MSSDTATEDSDADPFRFPLSISPERGRLTWLSGGFFDESTDEDTGGVSYTVAGYTAAQLVTATLELRWRDVLNKYGLEYFKASELNAGEGQFRKFRDDPDGKEWRPFSQRETDIFGEIKTAFTDVVVGLSDALYGLGAVVILPDLERLRAEYDHAKVLPKPYFICQNMVLVEAGRATDGVSAVEVVADLRPDLLVMDIDMPYLDGLNAAMLISARFPRTRIVLMSGDDSPELRADCIACGADAFVHKPQFRRAFPRALSRMQGGMNTL